MKTKPDLILKTVKVIFGSAEPISVPEIVDNAKLNERTVQRHISRLLDEHMIMVTRDKCGSAYRYKKNI